MDFGVVKLRFWIYENWTAENKARIHRADCTHCNDGRGIHPDKEEGRNGQWDGPYLTYSEAIEKARQLRQLEGRVISDCKKCQPSSRLETKHSTQIQYPL